MTVMPAPPSQHQWYLARDGQQYGPLTDTELAKFIELGHLQPTDLLWREGFPDWRPALVVFPQRGGAPQGSPPPAPLSVVSGESRPDQKGADAPGGDRRDIDPRAAPRPGAADDDGAGDEASDDPQADRRRSFPLRRAARFLLLFGGVCTAAWFAYAHREYLASYVASLPSASPAAVVGPTDRKGLEVPPLKGFAGDAATTDATLQAAPLWRILKREFPDWYGERVKEAAALAGQNKDEGAIAQQIGRALVALRRQQVDNALSAGLPQLKTVATSFFQNIAELRKQSTEACYAFISQGEASPVIVSLLQGSAHTRHLQTQLVAVFEAIADGRKTPRVYPKPRKTDYEVLAAELTARGWSQADMQLFSDERELARAAPDKICQLVHDWFAAQLELKDADVQLRLLVDSLRPVVAG